jgi:hypothetical protein
VRTDYFDVFAPDVTGVTTAKTHVVTPDKCESNPDNNDFREVLPVLPMLPIKSDNTGYDEAAAENIADHLCERAAILEFEAGAPREQAEAEARRNMQAYLYRLREMPRTHLIMIAPGTSLDEAWEGLRLRFGARLIDVKPYGTPATDNTEEEATNRANIVTE